MIRRALNTISTRMFPNVLPPDPASLNRSDAFYGFDRQYIRAALVLDILRRIGCDAFFETGTQDGATGWLIASQRRVQVFAVAESREAYLRARRLLAFYRSQVHLHHQDPRIFLNEHIADARLPFVYLNHAIDPAAVHDELRLVGTLFRQYVVMIDDFQLEHAAIAQELEAMAGLLYLPAYAIDLETGPKHRFVLVVPKSLAATFDEYSPAYLERA
jgi:hypothetical protein